MLIPLQTYQVTKNPTSSFQVTGLAESSNLDMAPNAFDDQYEGCVQEMEKKAPLLLQEDFNMNKDLKVEWEKAEKKWKEIKNKMNYPKGFSDYHGTAVVVYTGNHIYDKFNGALREFKKNSSNFHYKAFHYYLTRALQLLNNKNCYTVYRGTRNKFSYAGKGSVRFGQFASSSFDKKVALDIFGTSGTLFTIKTCLGVNITGFSYYSYEKEVLIPVYEVFNKVTVTPSGKANVNIFLNSPQRGKSNFNCFYSSGECGSVSAL
ncbi:T-cell ecto-ADP-ribosyltransferase 1 [Cricetulus griseus]|uniref:NAD(P)(+)--arginine ADP-ribosyltransferase n=1 Tax=Cricetulus griseus TaxID=10029 RepID=G3INJ9_CRIGR|nr:T-cell ecto-ADP-ribosyltransferase 1 [Cricetulus griseus]